MTTAPQPTLTSSTPMTMIAVPTKGSNKLYDILYLEENGTNFAFWKFRIELVLQIHNLWPLIDGMDKAPAATSPDYADWTSRDREACMQIALMLTDKPLNTVFQAQTALQYWDRLMTCYKGKGEQKIAYLIIELFQSTLSDNSPLNPQAPNHPLSGVMAIDTTSSLCNRWKLPKIQTQINSNCT